MARVYADVNATLGESWYDYGELLCVFIYFIRLGPHDISRQFSD
jgi:hypothetical protein